MMAFLRYELKALLPANLFEKLNKMSTSTEDKKYNIIFEVFYGDGYW